MMDRKRKWIIGISVALTAIFCAFGAGCGASQDGGKLSAPKNVRIEKRVLYWDEVPNADYYVVSASNGKKYETTECQLTLIDFQKSGDYEFKVFAKSHDEKYEVSTYGAVTHYLAAPVAEGEDNYHFKYKWVEELNGYEVSIGNAVLQEEVVIPDYFRDYPVKKIALHGFHFKIYNYTYDKYENDCVWYNGRGCNEITKSLQLPKYLEMIDQYAFWCWTSLEELVIPEGVTEIAYSAFKDCKGLKRVTFPDGLKTIGAGAFANTALETLDLPDTLTSIGVGAFGCSTVKDEYSSIIKYHHVDSELSRVVIPKFIKNVNFLNGRENLTTIVLQGVEYTYSATQPTEEGDYWYHNEKNQFTIWE